MPAMKFLGLLMLDSHFPRPLGDIGHADTFGFAVRRRVVPGASPRRVVQERSRGLLAPFIATARALVDEGAGAIATSCGFLVLFQQELQAALPVPVWTSSLLKLAEMPGTPGVITVDPASLSAEHLRAAGARPGTPVVGLEQGCSLQRTLLEDRPALDTKAARDDVLHAAQRLVQNHPEVDSIVLECTNLPPYADAVRAATGLPVHDIRSFLTERWAALQAR